MWHHVFEDRRPDAYSPSPSRIGFPSLMHLHKILFISRITKPPQQAARASPPLLAHGFAAVHSSQPYAVNDLEAVGLSPWIAL